MTILIGAYILIIEYKVLGYNKDTKKQNSPLRDHVEKLHFFWGEYSPPSSGEVFFGESRQ